MQQCAGGVVALVRRSNILLRRSYITALAEYYRGAEQLLYRCNGVQVGGWRCITGVQSVTGTALRCCYMVCGPFIQRAGAVFDQIALLKVKT